MVSFDDTSRFSHSDSERHTQIHEGILNVMLLKLVQEIIKMTAMTLLAVTKG